MDVFERIHRRRIHSVWVSMKQRCLNPNLAAYPEYGGRGISICAEWIKSFNQFYKDMGPCPRGYTLDRINNNGNYTPANCRWASWDLQANNRRNNRFIAWKGKTRSLHQWAKIRRIKYSLIYYRLRRGCSIDRVLEFKTKSSKAPATA